MSPRARLALKLVAAVAGGIVLLATLAALHPATRGLLRHALEPADPSIARVRSEDDLRAAFNAHADRVRVVAWLSPT